MARSSFSPFKPPSPRRFIASFRDLGLFLRTRTRADYVIALIAAAITLFVVFAFYHDSHFVAQPQIVYVQNWRADRTDAEIIAEQKKERPAREKALAEQQKALAERQREFKEVQKATSFWL